MLLLLVGAVHLDPQWAEQLRHRAEVLADQLTELARPVVKPPAPDRPTLTSEAPTLTRGEQQLLATYSQRPALGDVYPGIGRLLPAPR